ncbi:MAG TPA: molybdopterin cofactor-binding domain-containing protein [Methylomirabilota bacterium]
MTARGLSRRDFLAGGGLVIAFTLAPRLGAAQTPRALPGSLAANRRLDAWLRIDPNGTVTIFTGKIELGQGIGTALTQIAADELDVELARFEVVHGDTERTPNEGQTAGSLSVEQSGGALRAVCAEAREILLTAAAAKLGAPATDLRVRDGTITAPGGASVTYWALAADASLAREATAGVKPKPAAERRWVGRSVPRRDIPKKFTGGAAYVQDVRLPGMVFGRVVRPPAPAAMLVSVDEAAVRQLPGVIAVVRDGSFLAVAAAREEQAIRARQALAKSATWKEAPSLPPAGEALYEHLRNAGVPAEVVAETTAAGGAAPARTLEAVYTRPYQAHASIAPSCAVAQWQDGRLTVWTHSQGVFPLRAELARVFALRSEDVHCIHAEGAGCYGHNGADDVALDAALLARATGGRPVKLQWMREDEFTWEPYGSAMVMKLGGGLDAQGNIVRWTHELWSHSHSTRPGSSSGVSLLAARHLAQPFPVVPSADVPQPAGGAARNAIPLYDIPAVRVTKHYVATAPLRTSALRTLGAYANVFALESFMDELAAVAGADPVEFRLRHLKDARARAVVEAAAQRAGWAAGARSDGRRGRGMGFARYKNLACYVAAVADVEVDRASGRIGVTRVVAAVDAGQIVNPDGVVNQIEGGIIQSTSWTLKESVRFDRTRVTTRSWADYPILRFAEVPRVEVVLLDRPEERFLGVGEGAQGPTAAAIANAVAQATSRRLRALPFTPDRVKAAL